MNKKECILDCEHRVRLSIAGAKEGADAYCRFDGYRVVTTVFHREWRVTCTACTYGRWCGQNEALAKRIAYRHKHNTVFGMDVVTKSGGTPRKEILRKALRESTVSGTLVEVEEPPY